MRVLKVSGLTASDGSGGAARAALRIHHAVRASDVMATLFVNQRSVDRPDVQGPPNTVSRAMAMVRPRAVRPFLRLARGGGATKSSLALLPSSWAGRLNRSNADLVHLHWVSDEMLSIEDIGRINKPVVWTLHDMWAFCGAEHLAWDNRYRDGYRAGNRPPNESGLDLNRLTWWRKRRAWRRPIQIVTPSRWLAKCVEESALMREWPVEVIPNPIDLDVWRPVDKVEARGLLGIRADACVIAFGSMGENHSPHKGGDLLVAALQGLRASVPHLEVAVFGEGRSGHALNVELPSHCLGILHDELSLRIVYSAADALVVPSRIDNLPNTAVEALACGTPVVAFNTCGLPDLVLHQETGFLARPFEPEDLANGIRWVVEDPARRKRLSLNARDFAQARFAADRVGAHYRALYERTLSNVAGSPG